MVNPENYHRQQWFKGSDERASERMSEWEISEGFAMSLSRVCLAEAATWYLAWPVAKGVSRKAIT